MLRSTLVATLALTAIGLGAEALADTQSDRIACSTTVRPGSAEACSRLIASRSVSPRERFTAYFNRAWSYRRAGNSAQALVDLNEAEKLNDRYPNLFLSRAMVNDELGNLTASLADLDRYVSLEPKDWNGYHLRALVHRKLRAPKKAVADLDTAIALNPYDKQLPPLRILALSDAGNGSAAKTAADSILAARRTDPLANYARAVVLFRQGKRQAAVADLDVAIAASPLFAAAHTLKGEIEELAGRREQARESYTQALKIGGPEIDAAAARGKARRRLAQLDKTVAQAPSLEAHPHAHEPSHAPRTKTVGRGECRRFISSVAATVAVPCE